MKGTEINKIEEKNDDSNKIVETIDKQRSEDLKKEKVSFDSSSSKEIETEREKLENLKGKTTDLSQVQENHKELLAHLLWMTQKVAKYKKFGKGI